MTQQAFDQNPNFPPPVEAALGPEKIGAALGGVVHDLLAERLSYHVIERMPDSTPSLYCFVVRRLLLYVQFWPLLLRKGPAPSEGGAGPAQGSSSMS